MIVVRNGLSAKVIICQIISYTLILKIYFKTSKTDFIETSLTPALQRNGNKIWNILKISYKNKNGYGRFVDP